MDNKIVQIILAILLPPVGVLVAKGANKDFVINILLTICFFIPGLIHALYVILKEEN